MNFLHEQQRFFHNVYSIAIYLPSFLIILRTWRPLRHTHRLLFHFSMLLLLCAALLIEDKSTKYTTIWLPCLAMLVVLAVREQWHTINSRALRSVIMVTLVFSVGVGLWSAGRISVKKQDLIATNARLLAQVQRQAKVCGDVSLVFNELPHYQILCNYLMRYECNNAHNLKDYAAFCAHHNCEYLVLSRFGESIDNPPDLQDERALQSTFAIVHHSADGTVLRILPATNADSLRRH